MTNTSSYSWRNIDKRKMIYEICSSVAEAEGVETGGCVAAWAGSPFVAVEVGRAG